MNKIEARKLLAKQWRDRGRKELANTIEKGVDSEWTKAGPAIDAIIEAYNLGLIDMLKVKGPQNI